MIRPIAVLALSALSIIPAMAQETPTAPAAPSAPVIEIDPAATIDNTPKQLNLLTGLYATQAVIELCSVSVPEEVMTRMNRQRLVYETALGMDAATGTKAYERIRADVDQTGPDCTEGSSDRQGVDAVVAIYQKG